MQKYHTNSYKNITHEITEQRSIKQKTQKNWRKKSRYLRWNAAIREKKKNRKREGFQGENYGDFIKSETIARARQKDQITLFGPIGQFSRSFVSSFLSRKIPLGFLKMANNSNKEEPNTAPKPNHWYNISLGSSFKDQQQPSSKFCTLRCKFSLLLLIFFVGVLFGFLENEEKYKTIDEYSI